MAVTIKEPSKMGKEMGTESGKSPPETATNTKVSTLRTKSKAMGYLLGMLAIYTRGITWRISGKDTEKCTGLTAAVTKVTGIREHSKVKVNLPL
jgi:hypothetical protein